MESDSSDESVSAYTTLLNSVKRRVVKSVDKAAKRRKKRVKVAQSVIPETEAATSDHQSDAEEQSGSDGEEADPFHRHLNYQLTPDDLTLLSTPPDPELIRDHPLGHATLYPSPLPSCHLSSATPTQLHIRTKIARRLSQLRPQEATQGDTLTPLQSQLLPLLGEYAHVLYAQETETTRGELLEVAAVHILNHVSKGRRLVLRNNHRATHGDTSAPGDQGLVRPRVLALLPFRSGAYQLVQAMAQLCGGATHGKRLSAEFGPGEGQTDPSKPADYRSTFAGNADDCFKMGVALSGGALRLFAPFYASDVVIASPLGLRALVDEGPGGDRDFLSSLEVVFLDAAEVFQLQNWAHLQAVLRAAHQKPRALHGTDIGRVRAWALDQLGAHYCQLILFSQFLTPEIHSLFRSRASPRHPKLVFTPREYPGLLSHLPSNIPQVFKRLPPCPLSDTADFRFSHFSEKILPEYVSGTGGRRRTILFAPSYCDFLRLRNHLREVAHSVTHISEYSSSSQARRATSLFAQGQRDTLLLTERLLFFRAPRLPECSHLLLYGPPVCPQLHLRLLRALKPHPGATATCLFSAQDALALARILGARHTDRLLREKCGTQLVMSP